MINFEKLKKEKITVLFDTREEMFEFLKECEKNNIKWLSGDKATTKDYFDAYREFCIAIEDESLNYCSRELYESKGYKVINCKEFLNNKHPQVCINKILKNKETTIVIWNDDAKTLVKKGDNQVDSPEVAILWAYFEKNSGLSKTQSHKVMNNLVESIYNQEKKMKRVK